MRLHTVVSAPPNYAHSRTAPLTLPLPWSLPFLVADDPKKQKKKVARRQARSREEEETFLKEVSASIEGSASNPWARICDLVDLKKPVVPSKPPSSSAAGAASGAGGGGSGSGSRRGSATAQNRGMDEEEVFRATAKMRSLIIQVCVVVLPGEEGDKWVEFFSRRPQQCCRFFMYKGMSRPSGSRVCMGR